MAFWSLLILNKLFFVCFYLVLNIRKLDPMPTSFIVPTLQPIALVAF